MPETIRCKFTCIAIRTTLYMGTNPETNRLEQKLLDIAEFTAVTSGSEENKKFFQWTPIARLEIGVHRKGAVEVGKSYYIDVTPSAD